MADRPRTLGDWVSDNWENRNWRDEQGYPMRTMSPEASREKGRMYTSLFGPRREAPATSYDYYWGDDRSAYPDRFNVDATYSRPDAASLDRPGKAGVAQHKLPGPEWRRDWADELTSSDPERIAGPVATPLRRTAGATIRSEKYRTERRQAQSEATMRAADTSMFNATETKSEPIEKYKPRGFSGGTILHGPGTVGPVSY